MKYDIVGDIHGHANELELLLAQMGYQKRSGVWQHKERVLISVGDLIDRGRFQRHTIDILKPMVENGFAKVIMGNHEFNAIAYATKSESGDYLRKHTPKNQKQHLQFLQEANKDPEWYKSTIDWFKTFPLFLDLPEFRVVHACWHEPSFAVLTQYTSHDNVLNEDAWECANTKGTALYEALETILKGLEVDLPDNITFKDKDGIERNRVRVKWWLSDTFELNDIAMGVPKNTKLPAHTVNQHAIPGYDNQKPLFIGHYWMKGKPTLLTDWIACLDWSVASNGKIVAYRFETGFNLSLNHFYYVETLNKDSLTIEVLSNALFESDPMNTCCKTNDCFDEYDRIAISIFNGFEQGLTLFDSCYTSLESWFGSDLVSSSKVIDFLSTLSIMVNDQSKAGFANG